MFHLAWYQAMLKRSSGALRGPKSAWWRWPMPVVCCSSRRIPWSLQKISRLYDRGGFLRLRKTGSSEFDNLRRGRIQIPAVTPMTVMTSRVGGLSCVWPSGALRLSALSCIVLLRRVDRRAWLVVMGGTDRSPTRSRVVCRERR